MLLQIGKGLRALAIVGAVLAPGLAAAQQSPPPLPLPLPPALGGAGVRNPNTSTLTLGGALDTTQGSLSVATYPATGAGTTLHFDLVYGQSNAGAGGSCGGTCFPPGELLAGPQFPGTSVTSNTGSIIAELASLPHSGIAALQNGSGQPFLAAYVPMGFALDQYLTDLSLPVPMKMWDTVWYGGQPITSFVRGTQSYTDAIAAAQAFATLPLPSYPVRTIDAVWFIQGESGPTSGYQAALEGLAGQMVPDLQATTGQATPPKFIIFQTNDSSGAVPGTPNPVRLAQLAASQDASGIVLAGPEYYSPLNTTDNIHMVDIGREMQGEIAALVWKRLFVDGLPWNPLEPAAISIASNVIEVDFALPPGGGNLAWDTSWVNPAGVSNGGFVYTDNSSPPSISSVTLGGSGCRTGYTNACVLITLSAAPTATPGNRQVLYATGQSNTPGWSASRGLLISPAMNGGSPVQSYFYRLSQPSFSITSGTYNTSTGAITLTLNNTGAGVTPFQAGQQIALSGLAGTGGFASLNGTYYLTSVSGSYGTTLGLTAQTGLGATTITGGTTAQTVPQYINNYAVAFQEIF